MISQQKYCNKHGLTKYKREKYSRGYRWRCLACSYERQFKSLKTKKIKLVAACGGKCVACGYNRCIEALDFHHLDPETKKFKLSRPSIGLEKCLQEAKKCVILCATCHREVEAGFIKLDVV